MKTTPSQLMCKWNIHHVWENAHTSDGVRFVRCSRCLKERWINPPQGSLSGNGMTPFHWDR